MPACDVWEWRRRWEFVIVTVVQASAMQRRAPRSAAAEIILHVFYVYIYIKNTNWYAHTCISARSLHTNSCRTAFTFYVHNNDTINAIKIIASSLLAVKKINFTLK